MSDEKGQFELPLAGIAPLVDEPRTAAQRAPKPQPVPPRSFVPRKDSRALRGSSLDLPPLYTAEEVAGHLRVSVRTVKRFIASGKLEATRFGRTPRISEEALQTFLREGTCTTSETEQDGSFSNSEGRPGLGTFAGTNIDRRAVFQLARRTAMKRVGGSLNTPCEPRDPLKNPTHRSP